MKNKTSELISFIDDLCQSSNVRNDEFVNKVFSIYSDGWRHSYSELTSYLFLKKFSEKNDIIDNLNDLYQKITSLYDFFCTNFEDKLKDDVRTDDSKCYKATRRSIEKLSDHINLEMIRFGFNKRLEDSLSTYDSKSSELEIKYNEIKSNLKNQRTESITILGVFSSIVSVLVAGVGLSSAIFANMNNVNNYLLCALTVLVVMFVSNALFYLFNFLREIAERPAISNDKMNVYNVVLVLIAALCLYVKCYIEN